MLARIQTLFHRDYVLVSMNQLEEQQTLEGSSVSQPNRKVLSLVKKCATSHSFGNHLLTCSFTLPIHFASKMSQRTSSSRLLENSQRTSRPGTTMLHLGSQANDYPDFDSLATFKKVYTLVFMSYVNSGTNLEILSRLNYTLD